MRRSWIVFALVVSTGAGGNAGAAVPFVPGHEAIVHGQVNATRIDNGQPPIPRDTRLDEMARGQSAVLYEGRDECEAETGNPCLFHNLKLGEQATELGIKWLRLGENVGYGPQLDAIHEAFVASEGHFHNIIEPRFNAMGVGVVAGDDNLIYITHVFAELAEPPLTSSAKPPTSATAPPDPTPAPTAAPTPTPRPTPTPVPLSPAPNAVIGGFVDTAPISLAALFDVPDPPTARL